jgi:hypothetical protein
MTEQVASLTGLELFSAAIAVVLTAAWLAAAGIIRLRRRPHEPPVGPSTLDVGDEPPAVANLLVNHFRVTKDAVPATLLDLAARRIVEIEQTHLETYQCRLRDDRGDLMAYEESVVDVLRKRALNGVVPAGALTTGPAEESKRWWRRFERDVVADAQHRGLSRDLWDGRTLRALTVAAVAPSPFVVAPLTFNAGFVYAVGACCVIGFLKTGRRQRDTPVGLAAASRWLGVRSRLADDRVFPTAPPIAVALWERYLAYGAAFGVAPGAVRPIPMGAESDSRAWSSYGGRWREVRIRYPRLLPLGWGMNPASALAKAVLVAAVASFLLYLLTSLAPDPTAEDGGVAIAGAVLLGIPAAAALVAAIVIVKSVPDLRSTREVTGQIVRLRTFGSEENTERYVAVDDGSSAKIRAWRVRPDVYAPLTQYEEVTALLTPRLRYVRSIGPSRRPV